VSLAVAIPSKGRLQEEAAGLFAAGGLTLQRRDARAYRGGLAEMEGVEIVWSSASEIARDLAAGRVHLGITGEDLVRETVADADSRIALLAPLGFGHAQVVLAVPDAWIDVRTVADLDDVAATFRSAHGRRLRIATKYWNVTRAFLSGHGVALYRIVESLGATEGAPAAGVADVIVDITSTGSTLSANHLRILDDGVILKSEAHLAASRMAAWTWEQRSGARVLLGRLAGQGAAERFDEAIRGNGDEG